MSQSTISTFQLFSRFPDQESARIYLEGRLWPSGAICAQCLSGARITPRVGGMYHCNACNFDFSVRTNTIFEKSKVPLHKWLYSMYLLVTARKGISSMQLAKEIGVTQKTAWFVLGRLREACGGAGEFVRGRVHTNGIESVWAVLKRGLHVVLAYKPKPKSDAAKKRTRRAKKIAKETKGDG